MNKQLQLHIEESLKDVIGKNIYIQEIRDCRGGDINDSFHLITNQEDYFVKINSSQFSWMFEAEAEALQEIYKREIIKTPKVITTKKNDTHSWLILEYLVLQKQRKNDKTLAEKLFALHSVKKDCFGWHRNNTIGSTLQTNTFHNIWQDFFWQERLLPQLLLLQKKTSSLHFSQIEKLKEVLPTFFFDDEDFKPTFLHGDLWSGNVAFLENGEPVIFDPAFYYGDYEADIAMTMLFGGFSAEFYNTYFSLQPKRLGFEKRVKLYNFYHILNHANLFSGHYISMSLDTFKELLKGV